MKRYFLCFSICFIILFGILFINLADISFWRLATTVIAVIIVSLMVTFIYAFILKIFRK